MWTQEQIDTMAELNGRHMADRIKLGAKQQNERQAMFDAQAEEAKATAEQLGIPVDAPVEAPPVPNFVPGGMPPADAPPGVPVVIPPPGMTPTAPRALSTTPMPRPLKLRK